MKQIAIQGEDFGLFYHDIVAHHYFEGEEIEILGCKHSKMCLLPCAKTAVYWV